MISPPESFDDVERRMARVLDGIDGWLHPGEAAVLYLAARAATERSGKACLAEIGSWQGRTTVALSFGLRDGGGRGRVHAIDPHADPEHGELNYQALRRNIERAGTSELVEIVRCTSSDAVSRFPDRAIDLLFIDGDHNFDGVCLDILEWRPKLRPGAFVGFNDPFLPGVRRALRHLVLSGSAAYRRPRWAVNSLFFDFEPDGPMTRADRAARRRARLLLRVLGPYMDLVSRPGVSSHVTSWLTASVVRRIARQILPEARTTR